MKANYFKIEPKQTEFGWIANIRVTLSACGFCITSSYTSTETTCLKESLESIIDFCKRNADDRYSKIAIKDAQAELSKLAQTTLFR